MANQIERSRDAVAKGPACVTGDTHGNLYDIAYRLEKAHQIGATSLLIAGDVGLVYGKPRPDRHGNLRQPTYQIDRLEEACERNDITCIVMRGNHDTRYIRDMREGLLGDYTHLIDEDGSWYALYRAPHVLFASDRGGAYRIGGKDALLIPGAWSIDKAYRLYNGWPWEEEEQLDETERTRITGLASHIPFDAIVSHTCPLSWQAKMGDLLLQGAQNLDNTMELWLDEVLERVSVTSEPNNPVWYFGHYHADRKIEGAIGRLLFDDIVML